MGGIADRIESYPGGAIARQGQFQVIFANNLNSAGAVDLQDPDGKRLRSNILGLSYNDSSTGKSVMIAQIQDSQGELIASNQVLYPNAFSGVNAEVRYTYKKGSFEQDVILREEPPSPESFGLNPKTTEIEVLTEFINPPEAELVKQGVGGAIEDQDINWGVMRIIRGKAFELGESSNPSSKTSVHREYLNLQGRHILVEGVLLPKIRQALDKLPPHGTVKTKFPKTASKLRSLPKTPMARLNSDSMRLATASRSNKGYVLDYVEILTGDTDFTFQSDTTYLIRDTFYLAGTTTIEGGAVLKFGDGYSELGISDTLDCKTASYRPGVFTSIDDNAVGETISGSTGSPTISGESPWLYFAGAGQINNLRFCYASNPLQAGSGISLADVWNCQFVNCDSAITMEDWYGGALTLHNVLFASCNRAIGGSCGGGYNIIITGEQITADVGTFLWQCDDPVALFLTNSIIEASSSFLGGVSGSVITNHVVVNPPGPLFQTAGAGGYYLTNNSPYRQAGTVNIDPIVLVDIATRTTYPPLIYSNATVSSAATFSPQAQRDNIGNPDLGYHYDPLDYVFGNTTVNSSLTFTAGTAVGWFYHSSGGTHGLLMGDSATASFNGAASARCYWVKYNTVQEGGNGNWTAQSYISGMTGTSYAGTPPGLTAQFTTFSVPAAEAGPYRDDGSDLFVFKGNSCEFYNGGGGGYVASVNATNCLFYNSAPVIFENHDAANLTMQGCTCFRGNVEGDNTSGGAWPVTIFNCAFDQTTFYLNAHGGTTTGYYTDYNSFLQYSNTTPYLGGHEVTVVGGYNWQSSWLGDFYLPTTSSIINHGDTTANLRGLYHFTTQTSQTKEANSTVDIGYHYVAVDGYGNPIDTNGDGVPDYWEDTNGNGLVDSGEIGWNISGDLGFKVIISKPRNGRTMP